MVLRIIVSISKRKKKVKPGKNKGFFRDGAIINFIFQALSFHSRLFQLPDHSVSNKDSGFHAFSSTGDLCHTGYCLPEFPGLEAICKHSLILFAH